MGYEALADPASLRAASFDDFVATRPEEERWELVDGYFTMQATPTIPHSVMASNIERLLNDALVVSRPELLACREVTIVMRQAGIVGGGNYVPDVAVLDDSDLRDGVNSTETCFMAVEIVSPSDLKPVSGSGRPKIEIKVEGYAKLPSCEAVMTVDQGEIHVALMTRAKDGWTTVEFRSPDDVVAIPGFGLECTVADIYARTPALKAVPTSVFGI